MTQLVTGGAGFIGSRYILSRLQVSSEPIVNLDALTYAGNLKNLARVAESENYTFVKGDINDRNLVARILREHKVTRIINFAAESHVDNSISKPAQFIETNVQGTLSLLQASLDYFASADDVLKKRFKFYQISTDEVYGSLASEAPAFTENSHYRPNSPYSASKAAADHLVRAFFKTYGLPVIMSHCSNNYGPNQHTEKLVPRIIWNALSGLALPLYGTGQNIREWLHVDDHCSAISLILEAAKPGDVFNIGSNDELTNLQMVTKICDALQELVPRRNGRYQDLLTFVQDRPGHDERYSVNWSKINEELGWAPRITMEKGLTSTIAWYVEQFQQS